jgi:ABC-type transport system involved in multi-copper enzyme maturation permease subunit
MRFFPQPGTGTGSVLLVRGVLLLLFLAVYGLPISTLVRSPGAAVAVGISTLVLIDFSKHLVGLDPYIFTRYINYSWLTLLEIAQGMDYQWRPEVWKMIALSGVSAVITFGAGLILFVRQDLNH